MSEQIFDLFGDPVPDNWGRRGRPQHIATQQNRNKVNLLLAFGWSNERIAKALRITAPTLRRNYFRELKFRDEARDRLDASMAMKLWNQVEQGKIPAIKEFRKLIDQNDLAFAKKVTHQAQPADKPMGKKAAANAAAQTAHRATSWGEVLN